MRSLPARNAETWKRVTEYNTPRFCNVTLEAVYGTEKELRAAGYTEPTHYQNDRYVIRGKSTGFNRMVFAAAVRYA